MELSKNFSSYAKVLYMVEQYQSQFNHIYIYQKFRTCKNTSSCISKVWNILEETFSLQVYARYFSNNIKSILRSGSSLLGRVLSADYNSIYLFEPFHGRIFKYENGTPVDLHHHIVNENMIRNYTNQLFNCMHVRN